MVDLLSNHAVGRSAAMDGMAAERYRQQAYGLIDRAIHREALLLAYSDAFLIAGIAMVICAAGSMLLGRRRR